MVQNFTEETNEKQSNAKCARSRWNCFNGHGNDSSDDESDYSEIIKSLIPCATVAERNLLADAAMIVEKNSANSKRKDDLRKIVTDGLQSLGYDSSICKSKWDKCQSFPAGEHEFIVVVVEGERLLVDIDFRSEFAIARSTSEYKAILQSLPYVIVGKPERIGQIVSIMSEAIRLSLHKKGMHCPPWRKAEYMRAMWSTPFTRAEKDGKNLGGGGGGGGGGGDDDDNGNNGSGGGENGKKEGNDGNSNGNNDKGGGSGSGSGNNGILKRKQVNPTFGFNFGYHAGNEHWCPVGQLQYLKKVIMLETKTGAQLENCNALKSLSIVDNPITYSIVQLMVLVQG